MPFARAGIALPTMNPDTLAWWVDQLKAAGAPAAGIDLSAPFRDDHGHTRPVDVPFIAWLRRRPPDPPLEPGATPDVALWDALARDNTPAFTDNLFRVLDRAPRTTWDSGALLPQRGVALEAWTEADLCAIHALWRLARRHNRPEWLDRVNRAALWHLENVQPDNATAHPWAAHVFALMHASNGDGAARLHAELLMHNCRVNLGRADRLSALILMDAADAVSEVLRATH